MDIALISDFVPAAFSAQLGLCGPPSAVVHALRFAQPDGTWFRVADEAYAVASPDPTISLMLQCVNAKASPEDRLWGVHGWSGTVRRGTLRHPIDAFVEVHGQPIVRTDSIVIFEGVTPAGRAWCAHCHLSSDHVVEMVTVIRMGDWLPMMPIGDPIKKMDAAEAASLPAPSGDIVSSSVFCRSSGIVPRTGWYEARLPADHPGYRYFSQSNGRFVRKHQGERMLTLGVVPMADEDLVVWTWRGESLR